MRTSLMMAIALTVALFAVVPAVAIPRIEQDLATRAAAALALQDHDWASVAADGRSLEIGGEAPSASVRDGALLAAAVAGVRDVIDQISLAPQRSYALQAVRTPDALTLSGTVPDQETADAVLAAIRAADAGVAIDSVLDIVPGDAGPGWREAAATAGDRAARLLDGTVALTEDGLVVTGSVPDQAALDIVRAGPTDPAGPPLSVDVSVLAPRLYQLTLIRDADRLVLAGEAPDAFSRDALVALAERQGIPRVEAEGLVIATGVASDDWHRLSSALVRHVGAMRQADARLEPGSLTLSGVVADAAMAELTRTALASVFGDQIGMTLAIDIRTPDAAAVPAAEPEIADSAALLEWAESADVPEIGPDQSLSPNDCQTALNDLAGESRIAFVGTGPDLDPAGRGLLEALALTIRRCPDAQIEVSGHTEATDDPAAGEAISAARAEAVVDYLIRRGVDESRLVAAGYGDMVPIADNATVEGRERNRRIEFLVVPAQ